MWSPDVTTDVVLHLRYIYLVSLAARVFTFLFVKTLLGCIGHGLLNGGLADVRCDEVGLMCCGASRSAPTLSLSVVSFVTEGLFQVKKEFATNERPLYMLKLLGISPFSNCSPCYVSHCAGHSDA